MWQHLADWFSFKLLPLDEGSRLGDSVNFFVYDSLKILFLLLVMTYLMSLMRYYLPIEKLRDFLLKRNYYGLEYLLAASFGALTPFCSCSSIPLFMGFVGAGIPLGVTFSFLITSPLINEVAIALFVGLFGWKITGLYLLAGMIVGIVGGYVIGKLNMERYVEEFLLSKNKANKVVGKKLAFKYVWKQVSTEAWEIFSKVVWYVLLGIGVGAIIHGYVPEGFFESYIQADNWWTVPLAVVLAVPLYANAQGVIPIMQSLVVKGIPLGTALAFMMATVGLSLPEALILKKVIKLPLLLTFFGIVTLGIVLIGYVFNLVL